MEAPERARLADRGTGSGSGTRIGVRARRRETGLYLAAAATFVALGVVDPRFVISWPEGASFLLLVAWGLPSAWRRLRR
jgi:hypothetical protein